MKRQEPDRVILVGVPDQVRRSFGGLLFVPPLRLHSVEEPPDPEATASEPLFYLLGRVPRLEEPGALEAWLDRLAAAGSAPVALLLPRSGHSWCAAALHPQFCGLLPCETELEMEALERVLRSARRLHAQRRVQAEHRRGRFGWSLLTAEAADIERVWLLVESVLQGLTGPSAELARVGMAFSEALANAVEHGNLELGSSLKDGGPEGMARFFEERARRLQDPQFRSRRVHLDVWLRGTRLRIRLRNEGARFDPAEIPISAREFEAASPYGLGLAMMRSLVDAVSLSRDGRTLTLRHRLRSGLPDRRGLEAKEDRERERPAA